MSLYNIAAAASLGDVNQYRHEEAPQSGQTGLSRRRERENKADAGDDDAALIDERLACARVGQSVRNQINSSAEIWWFLLVAA